MQTLPRKEIIFGNETAWKLLAKCMEAAAEQRGRLTMEQEQPGRALERSCLETAKETAWKLLNGNESSLASNPRENMLQR
jgi:hypothetical protein